jgi:predicted transglutaminase-like protease
MCRAVEKWLLKRQSCPNRNDIEIVSDLAKNLRSDQPIKTISNVLEWQDKYISYSYEKTGFFFSIGFLVLILALLIILKHNFVQNWTTSIYWVADNYWVESVCWIASILFYGMISCYLFVSKKNIRGKYEILKLYWFFFSLGIFRLNIPVEKIIRYNKAICRDYAKLSCAILIPLKTDAYLVKIPLHTACAAKVGGDYYLIDQNLPLKKMDEWLIAHNKKQANVYQVHYTNNKTYLSYCETVYKP